MLETNTVHQGDCLEIMKSIDDKSVDFILCDPPYGITAPQWDRVIDFGELWKTYNRILKDTGTVALFGTQPFTSKLIMSNIDQYRYCWYWFKNQGTNFFHATRMPIRKVEEIVIFSRNGIYQPQITDGHIPTSSAKGCGIYVKLFKDGKNKRDYEGGKTTRFPTNVLDFKCVNNYKRLHSSEKPVELLEYLIRTYTKEGDLVLDNCAGSGSVGEACMNLSRKFILIEKESGYITLIKDRLKLKEPQ